MPGPKHTLVSALALSLAFTIPAAPQVPQSDYETPEDLPPAVQERLSELAEACENAEGAAPNLPEGLDCDSVMRLADMQDDTGDTDVVPDTGETTDVAPDQDNPKGTEQGQAQESQAAEDTAETPEADPQAAEAAPEQAEQTEGQETQADPPAQGDNADTPAEAAETDAQEPADIPAEQAETGQAAEAPAGDTSDPQAAEQDVTPEEQAAEQQQDADPQTEEPAATQEPAPEEQAADQAPTDQAGESVAPQTEAEAQAQADAVAQSDNTAAAAAAQQDASADSAEAEVVEETIAEQDVRQSSEDFETGIDQSAEGSAEVGAEARDEDDDDNDTLRNAAILGLGALALSQILGDNAEVVSNSGDRIVVQEGDRLRVLRNDDVLLRRPGAEVQTYRFQDGSTRNVVSYDDGTQVETIRTADGRVLRRTRILRDGSEVVLFDDTQQEEQVVVNELPQTDERRQIRFQDVDPETLADALRAQEVQGTNRAFTLNQVRNIDRVRQLVPEISVTTINFETASAAIRPREAEELAALGNAMRRMIERDPREVFLIEGHTDAVGNAAYNLALSDRRAESVALALTEYFDVPPANMVLQGYGESDLLVPTAQAEHANRRAAVRRITPLLRQSASR
ncbi:Outer membrane protein OmpA [Lutimaribacter pacificus]|uniref:Outer membrane protein OmpA n=1 Tax=Lutimaribacter pacificus TaxID=391948 RepID=A0A1H0ASP4_9RHOB|nr:OmpA family protein [Lutimaribacter pacificus]SDN36497.1 Outer membrane protein OmpA [Lutimaribacter pacificus]SHJ65377.1 Outer membrane protein OmpA [Lutimaribacter pacificus]